MEIKPLKKIKQVKQSGISTDDFLERPQIKSPPRQPGESTLEFVKRQIYLNGKEVGQVIKETAQQNPQLLAKIANELEKFKKKCLKKRKRGFLKFGKVKKEYSEEDLSLIFAICDAYIARVSELIKRRYDETKDGLNVVFDEDGQLILNGMNISMLIEKCRENPNPKSLIFLKGIRGRLEHVLENKVNSRNYDRIQEVIEKLFVDIDKILG